MQLCFNKVSNYVCHIKTFYREFSCPLQSLLFLSHVQGTPIDLTKTCTYLISHIVGGSSIFAGPNVDVLDALSDIWNRLKCH